MKKEERPRIMARVNEVTQLINEFARPGP